MVFAHWGLLGALLTLGAGVGYGLTIIWNWGNWDPTGFRFMLFSLAAGLGAAALAGRGPRHGIREVLAATAILGLVIQVVFLISRDPPTRWAFQPSLWFDAARWFIAIGAILVIVGFAYDRPALMWTRRAFLLLGFLLGGLWTIRTAPNYEIDVWSMTQTGAQRLLHLQNPYSQVVTFPGFDLSLASYPYPPVTLLLQTPFYAIFGEVRVTQLVAFVVLAVATVRIAERSGLPSALADAFGAIISLPPIVFYLLGHAWTEPLNAALLALALWSLVEGRMRWATVLFGLAVFSKQFLVVLFPIMFLIPGFGRKRALIAGAIAGAIALPFFLWNPERFFYGLVTLHLEAIPWLDPNTLAYYLSTKGIAWPSTLGIVGWIVGGIGVAYWRRDTEAGPWLGLGIALALFFGLGSRSYANYYWLTGAVFVLASILVMREALRRDAPQPIVAPATVSTQPAMGPEAPTEA